MASQSRTVVVACTAAILILTPARAEAQYLDPGAGSIITQVVIAVVVGLAATLKLYWVRISRLLGRRPKSEPKL